MRRDGPGSGKMEAKREGGREKIEEREKGERVEREEGRGMQHFGHGTLAQNALVSVE